MSALLLSCEQKSPGRPEPALTILESKQPSKVLRRDQLLHHPSARFLVVQDSPAYPGKPLRVRAVPLASLISIDKVEAGEDLRVECLDGFAASIPAEMALADGPDAAVAMLAVEDPATPWPPLQGNPRATAGPFYLVWENPSRGGISVEQWPFQVKSIAVVPSPEKEFPGLAPSAGLPEAASVREGLQCFLRNCFSCHRLNGMGHGHLGPDLNLPLSPTEYFRDGILERYIRDPGSIRKWDGQRMPSFPETILPEEDLRNLCAYLRTMADMKRRSPGS
jgi:mono/diheme cytochrome c family protein